MLPHDVTIVGSFTASLKVSTSGTDSDFVVKLIDVYTGDYPNPSPNPKQLQMGGYQQLGVQLSTWNDCLILILLRLPVLNLILDIYGCSPL